MATTARVPPPASKRPASGTAPAISRGATARSAVNPRFSSSLTSPARRSSLSRVTPPTNNGETRESLAQSLRNEIEQKEQLLVQLQDKEQIIATLTKENANYTSAINAAETSLNELYTEQSRMDEELSARMDVIEKLRSQVRELEKEKRDVQRRYNEQTSTFEAERQAFYDNEQHLKSRIQSLSQARKQHRIPRAPSVVDPESEAEWMESDDQPSEPTTPLSPPQELNSEAEPAEMTALKLELSTLSTSHASLQSTLQLLQTQLIDIKRVNNQLQEDNESYNILLREKTLSGTFDLMKQVGGISETSSDLDDEETEGDEGEVSSLPNSSRSALGTVEERDERVDERADDTLDPGYNQINAGKEPGAEGEETMDDDHDSIGASTRGSRKARSGRRRAGSTSQSPGATRGESLAGLPITGPGLDLAAELGRAENNAILEGQSIDDRDKSITNKSGKRGKKTDRKMSYASEAGGEPSDVEALKNEVKSLKDANKALSLYASKIIDRIISQEGFEHVLAADYEKHPPTPNSATMQNKTPTALAPPTTKTQRRASMFSRSSAPPPPETTPVERLTTFNSPPLSSGASSTATSPTVRTQRRSLSFDWRGFSVFGGGEKKDTTPNLRPVSFKPGTSTSVPGARKLDTQEDDDDRRERERLAATMKLMGIEKPLSPPVIHKSFSTPAEHSSPSLTISPPLSSPSISTPSTNRFSLFRRASSTPNSDGDSTKSPMNLTEDALVMSEAESTLAALDAQEKAMSAEMAKGASGGFTEIVPRHKSGSRRSRTSGGGSGSTVWSAGMSRETDDGDD